MPTHWREEPLTSGEGPQSFLFFVVAKVGPGASSRPIAVTLWQGGLSPNEAVEGLPVARACLQVIDILSDPGNRTAIRAELGLAIDFYKNDSDGLLVGRTELPELNRWWNDPTMDAKRSREWHRHFPEFPFISTCLLVGVGYDQSDGSKNNARTELLGTVYHDDSIEYGMVVVDISDLDDIRYGIVGFMVRQMVEIQDGADDDWDPCYDGYEGVPTVEESRPRKPLSANEYMTRFHPNRFGDPYAFGDIVKRLEEKSLIAVSAMDVIWPSSVDAAVIATQTQEDSSTNLLDEQDITRQIDSLLDAHIDNELLLDKLRAVPNLQDIVHRHLRERSEQLNINSHAGALGQLLGIAFSRRQHLDWILLKGLTTDAIAAAVQTQELKDAKSISLCVDTIHATPIQLLDSLSLLHNLREIYFVQGPARETDNQSTEVFLALSLSNHLSLLKCKLFFTGAFSAGLRKSFWLPTTSYKPNIQAFPIQHMFVRQKLDNSAQFWPNHFYLGDALLHPERFAAGFLQYLRSLITENYMAGEPLYSFACAPSTLTETSSTEISPIPAETFAIPRRPIMRDEDFGAHAECWPKVRDLVEGSWVVLVSKEIYLDREAARSNTWPPIPSRATHLKYALLRLKTQLRVDEEVATLTPGMVQVGGLKEFLHIMAPEVSPELVDQRLQELEGYISGAPEQAALRAGLNWLSVFEQHEACSILGNFLEDATFVKENLKQAMEENPTEHNWYPELFEEQAGQGASRGIERRHARNTKIFKAIY